MATIKSKGVEATSADAIVEARTEPAPAPAAEPALAALLGVPELPKPSVGRVVHYRLAVRDIMKIRDLAVAGIPLTAANGHSEGQVVPAVIVRVFDENGSVGAGASNLKVMVDGQVADLWVTSATRGDKNGQWNWPARV
jgi:hypothetical protein